MPRPSDTCPLACRNPVHLRRRAQRAEEAVERLERRLENVRTRLNDERAALIAYLESPQHDYDQLLSAEEFVGRAVRGMSTRHQTCQTCGGFSRKALDDLLAPALREMRIPLGLPAPEPLDDRAGPWPVRPGERYYGGNIVRPYEKTQSEVEEPLRSLSGLNQTATWRPPHWNAATGLSEW